VPRALSLPVLLGFAVGLALLLWLEIRRPCVGRAQAPWLIGAMALLSLGMILALLAVPATPPDTLVRVLLLVECAGGIVLLGRRVLGA